MPTRSSCTPSSCLRAKTFGLARTKKPQWCPARKCSHHGHSRYSTLARQAGNACTTFRVVVKAAELWLSANGAMLRLCPGSVRRPRGTDGLGITTHGAIGAGVPRAARPLSLTDASYLCPHVLHECLGRVDDELGFSASGDRSPQFPAKGGVTNEVQRQCQHMARQLSLPRQ